MQVFKRIALAFALVTAVAAQSPEPPLNDSRLSIHTLVREDIFAGFLTDDMDRFSRGEKNIDALLEKRPDAKADLLAWKAGATLYRAVRAHENKNAAEFKETYRRALDIFSQASQAASNGGGGVAAVTGGSFVLLSDRLPIDNRAEAWSQAYNAFQILWKQQGPGVGRLPVHMRGELLGGLAQSAQRTGRKEEVPQYLDKIIELLRDTPYETVAKKWKSNPESASGSSITCLTCHESGRLSARVAALNAK